MILPPISEISYHYKVTKIKMSPTSLSPSIDRSIEPVCRNQFYVGSLAGLLDEQIQCPTDI